MTVANESAVVETKDLTRRFGSTEAVDHLNLTVPRGAAYGLLGLNGAGKSTTIRMIMGMLMPTSGSLSVLGFDPSIDATAIRERVGYVPDAANFYDWMTIGEIIAFVAGIRKKHWDSAHAERLRKDFDLDNKQKLGNLSKGQRTRVSLLLALAFNPEFLVLDEPTGGLDPVMRRELLKTVLSDYLDDGRTILISSHLVNEISGLVDHVGIIKNGKLIRSERVGELLESTRRIRLFFEGDAPVVECDGLLNLKREGREATLTVQDFNESYIRGTLLRYEPRDTQIERLNLEDAFVEIMTAERKE